MPVEVQDVEEHERDRRLAHLAPHRGLVGQVHPVLEALEARPPVLVEGDDLAVEQRGTRPERPAQRAQLGVLGCDVTAVAALQADLAALDPDQRPHAVPFDLVGPPPVLLGQPVQAGEHRRHGLGQRLRRRVGRRVHAMDHPVVAAGAEQDVAALDPLAVEGDHDLGVAPLVLLVGPVVPDAHRARAVVALRDVALPAQVLERVVLGVHGQPVVVRAVGDPLGHRPGDRDAVVLEAEVPVQAAGRVLLDDEARGLAGARPAVGAGLGRVL